MQIHYNSIICRKRPSVKLIGVTMTFMPPSMPAAASTGSPLAPRKVSFGQAISRFYGNYANFSGRASRSEYWFVWLYSALIGLPLSRLAFPSVDPATGYPIANQMWLGIMSLWFLANLVPSLAVLWRRFHDVNKSGGYYFMALIPIVGAILVLIALCTDSDAQQNRFGPAA
jgi:uncharacterized membrane protein YhaH (DUF805 family)